MTGEVDQWGHLDGFGEISKITVDGRFFRQKRDLFDTFGSR
jgi:hypothetical protein